MRRSWSMWFEPGRAQSGAHVAAAMAPIGKGRAAQHSSKTFAGRRSAAVESRLAPATLRRVRRVMTWQMTRGIERQP